MDVKLSNGDIAVTPAGGCTYISGVEEAAQRARIAALTVKGSVVYDRELGTDYSGLSRDDALLREKLDMRIRESCADIDGATVTVPGWNSRRNVAILRVAVNKDIIMTEVDLSEYIQ